MSVSERIRTFRKKKGMTLKQLGQALGFAEHSAEIRISQYESGSRIPRQDVQEKMASVLDVSPEALSVPNIDSETGLLFTLFALEDRYGFKVCRSGSQLYLLLGQTHDSQSTLTEKINAWSNYAEMLKNGRISKQEYDHWRYNFPAEPKASRPASQKRKGTKKK